MIPVQHIVPNPNQPRRQWKEEELESLSQSIRTSGVLQPITVRRLENSQYELIAGERRLRASKKSRADGNTGAGIGLFGRRVSGLCADRKHTAARSWLF